MLAPCSGLSHQIFWFKMVRREWLPQPAFLRRPLMPVVVKLFVAKIDQLKGVFWALVRAPVCLG